MSKLFVCYISRTFLKHMFLPRLMYASSTYLLTSNSQELAVGMIARLVLADPSFVQQFSMCVKEEQVTALFYQ